MSATRKTQKDIKEPKGFVCFFGKKEPVIWERETYRYVYKVRRLKKVNNDWVPNKKIFDEKMDKEEIYTFKNNTFEVLSYSEETPQTKILHNDDTYINKTDHNIHSSESKRMSDGSIADNVSLYIIDQPGEESKQPFQVRFIYDDIQETKENASVEKAKYKRRNKRTRKDSYQQIQFELVL